MQTWIILAGIILLILLSLWIRINNVKITLQNSKEDIKASPLSIAIQNLVGIAGGIYVSVIMITSFLKLEVPGTITFANISFDPLAVIALGIAIVQPFVMRIISR